MAIISRARWLLNYNLQTSVKETTTITPMLSSCQARKKDKKRESAVS
jgi:hypothetical protein